MAAVGKQAWFALMNRKSRTAARRSPEQTRPRLLKEYRAPAAAACSHAAAGSTHHARMRSDQEPPPPGGPRFGQPGRPTREWSGRLAQTRGLARQDYVQHGRGRPSVGETPANTVECSWHRQHLWRETQGVHQTGSIPDFRSLHLPKVTQTGLTVCVRPGDIAPDRTSAATQ